MLFRISQERYGLPILDIREIVAIPPITRVPHAHASIRGVVNLHGRITPVVDLGVLLHLRPIEINDQSVIVVLHHDPNNRRGLAGLLVDEVLDVIHLQPCNIASAPAQLDDLRLEDLVAGIGTLTDHVVVLLRTDSLLKRPSAWNDE
jgi:purine-binding chemotaxis protein CheW